MRHTLSFTIFEYLSVVEVNHLEIVLGRLRVAPGGFPGATGGIWGGGGTGVGKRVCHEKESSFWTINNYIINPKRKYYRYQMMYARFLEPSGQPCRGKTEELVGLSVFSVSYLWDPLASRLWLTSWPITELAGWVYPRVASNGFNTQANPSSRGHFPCAGVKFLSSESTFATTFSKMTRELWIITVSTTHRQWLISNDSFVHQS